LPKVVFLVLRSQGSGFGNFVTGEAVWKSRWRFGAPGGRLELQMAVLSSRYHSEVQVVVCRSRQPFGAPDGRLELQVAIWKSRWPFGSPGGRLELQVAV